MNRMKAILAAGTLTGLILVTGLAFGWGRGPDTETAAEAPVVAPELIVNPVVMPAGTDTAVAGPETPAQIEAAAAGQQAVTAAQEAQAYQAYAAELEAALQTMQAREAEYRQQIETANQTVLQLQDQLNSQIAAQAAAPAPAAAVAAPAPASQPATYQDSDDQYEKYEDDDDGYENEGYESEEYDDD